MTRGEIWWADLGVPFGSEPGFRRPVLVVQTDSFNRSRIGTVLCVPFTTNLKLADAPGNVHLDAESDLRKESVIVVSQMTCLDRIRLGREGGKHRAGESPRSGSRYQAGGTKA